jgi:3-phenylpropionate/trans-cinnamate dioxygenase ferredoxin reductase component
VTEVDVSTIVIVGGGECAARAAVGVRDLGFAGRVVVAGEEPDAPYERPPLSKSALAEPGEPQPRTVLSVAGAAQRGIDLRLGDRVVDLDRASRSVGLNSGTRIAYDRLLLATGARARHLAVPGGQWIDTVRTLADARRLGGRLREGASVVVIGAGFVGLEVAASARHRGCRVAVVEVADRAMGRAVPEPLADLFVKRHIAENVDFRFGTEVSAIERTGDTFVVHLARGGAVDADVVVAGVGAIPNTELAEVAELAIDNGIAVDGHLATSDSSILAAGDCCSSPHPLFGDARIRLESWRAAQDQAVVAAQNLVGGRNVYDAVPWFWSDQYDLTLQISGIPAFVTREVVRHMSDGTDLHFGLGAGGRLVSAATVSTADNAAAFKSVRIAERLIAARAVPDVDALADARVALRSMLPTTSTKDHRGV